MRKTADTIICEITEITPSRITLDCGHFVDIPGDLPQWMRDGILKLAVGKEEICPQCIEEELGRGTDA